MMAEVLESGLAFEISEFVIGPVDVFVVNVEAGRYKSEIVNPYPSV